MHIYRPRLTVLAESEVLRYAGQKKSNDLPVGDVTAACREALLLAQPQCIWGIYDYQEDAHRILTPQGDLDLCSESLRRHLEGCHRVVALAVTVGPLIEEQVEVLFSQGNYNSALLLDAAGSTAAETTAEYANLSISSQMAKFGFHTLRRFSPGYGDWDLSVQPELLPLTGGSEIGISVTSSFMLTPRKSITALIGVRSDWIRDPYRENVSDEIPCNLPGCLARKGDS